MLAAWSIQLNAAALVYSPCVFSCSAPGLIFPPISPAARQAVSSTIKGCAIMKGALTEAIYFPAQRRKVPPVQIFRRSLCVYRTVALWEGTRRAWTRWTNGVGWVKSPCKTMFNQRSTSILGWIYLKTSDFFCPPDSTSPFGPDFPAFCSRLPPLTLSIFVSVSLLCCGPPTPAATCSLLFLCSVCSSEVY